MRATFGNLLICSLQAFFKSDLRLPAQCTKPRTVHELAWRTIGLGKVGVDGAGVAHCSGYGLSNFQYGHVLPASNVNMAQHGLRVLAICGLGQVHDVHAGRSHVVHIQEFSFGSTRPPNSNTGRLIYLCFVKATDESWDDMGVFRVVVVARAV